MNILNKTGKSKMKGPDSLISKKAGTYGRICSNYIKGYYIGLHEIKYRR